MEYVRPIGNAYEFELRNDSPADRTVRFFHIDPPRTQSVIYKVTEDVYANVNSQGQVTLPGGNVSYVPAAEFRELDGQKVSAHSSLKFRVPPLSSRSWMEPEAAIVDVRYEVVPSNPVLSTAEDLLGVIGIRPHIHRVRYLVIDNYWTRTSSASIDEAIRVFCRDNEAMEKSVICAARR